MKKAIIIALSTIILLIIVNKKENIIIPEESIRFRIIAASNTVEDQFIKEILSKTLMEQIKKINNAKTIENSREIINENMKTIEDTLNKKLLELNIDEYLNIKYGNNYFPKKVYKGVEYPEGYYESLVIEIGEAKGENYWCVLFPPLCMLENTTNDEVEYKFFVQEIINKIFNS